MAERGWYAKYRVQKIVLSHRCQTCNVRGLSEACTPCPWYEYQDVDPEAVYFVLRLDTDRHARRAMQVYADSVAADNPDLARDIRLQLAALEEIKEPDRDSDLTWGELSALFRGD